MHLIVYTPFFKKPLAERVLGCAGKDAWPEQPLATVL